MKRIIPIFIAVVIAITSLSFNVFAVAGAGVAVGAASGLGALGSLAGATGGSLASRDIALRDTSRLDDWLEFGKDTDSDYLYLKSLKNDILSGSVLQQKKIDAAVYEASQIMMNWYERNFSNVYTFDEAMYISFASDYDFTNEIEREAAEIIKNAYNEAFSETGDGISVTDSFEYNGYIRNTSSIPYTTYKGAIDKAIAIATGLDESNVFSVLNSDGSVTRTSSLYHDSAISYFDENDIYYQSCDIFTGFDIFTSETSLSTSDKSFFCQTSADYGYTYLIHPYIVVDGNVYISKNAACQLYWGGSGVAYNFLTSFGNETFSFYNSGVKTSNNLFGNFKPTSIDDDFFARLWLDFSSGNMVVKLAENKSAYVSESKCYSALYTVTFDYSIESSTATSVDFKEETTSSGCTIWNYTVTGNVAIAPGSDCFYNLLDLSDTISYSEIASLQEQGSIIDSGYMMKTTAIMTADGNNYTAAIDTILNLPVSLIEYSALTQAADKGVTADELNPIVSISIDTDPTTGDIVNTDVVVGDDVISGAGAGDKDKEKDLVYVPSISSAAENTETSDLTGSLSIDKIRYDVETPSIITYKFPFSLPFDVYNIFNLLSASPESPKFSVPLQSTELGINESIEIDLSEYDWIAEIVRWFVYVVFCIGIIKLTNNLIGRGG